MRILSALLVVAAVAGCAQSNSGASTEAESTPAPTGTPTVAANTPSARPTSPSPTSPSPSATRRPPTTIPLDAFLHREDTSFGPGPVSHGPREYLEPWDGSPPLPHPCATVRYRSDRQISVRRTGGLYLNHYQSDGSAHPTVVFETITRYTGTGARDYLAEVRRAVAACPTIVRDPLTYRYRIARTGFVGDESFAIAESVRERYTEDSPWIDNTYLIIVIRLGTTVVVVHDRGWEAHPTRPEEMYQVGCSAAARIRDWIDRL